MDEPGTVLSLASRGVGDEPEIPLDDGYVEMMGKGIAKESATKEKKATAARTEKERKEAERAKLLSLKKTIDTSIQLPPLEEIAGLFPRGYLSFVVSRAGTGKTWFIERMVVDLSSGGAIFNGFNISGAKKTLILAGEAGWETLIRRATAMHWIIRQENVVVLDEFETDEAGVPLDIDTTNGRERIEMLIEELNPDVLLLDSLMCFHSSDENSSKEMGPIYSYLRKTAKKYNIAIVICHHVRKRKMNERNIRMNQDEVIGSSVLNRYAAVILGLEEVGDDKDKDKPVLVSVQKSWRKKPMPFTFLVTEDEYGDDVMKFNLDPIFEGGAKDRILMFIETTYEPGEWFSVKEVMDGAGTQRSYTADCLKRWTKDKTLMSEGAGNRVRYARFKLYECTP